MSEIYYGRGNETLYDDYLDFINYVFGFNGNSNDFKKLLPKMYKHEDRPVENAYITLVDGKIKAGIGVFDHSIMMCGTELKCRGVGNVAVHPYERSKGYMRKLLNMAVDDMIKDGIDLTVLGGRRQRYNYFSYERLGTRYNFSINNDNMRHNLGTDRSAYHTFDIKNLQESDSEYLDKIQALTESKQFYPVRPRERLYDYLTSWQCRVAVLLKNSDFSGYMIYNDKTVYEVILKDDDDFLNAIVSFYDNMRFSGMTVYVPSFCKKFIMTLYRFCESSFEQTDKQFSVLNYKKVILASARFKSTYERLPDGEFSILIHGRAGDENLLISCKNGEVKVEEHEGKCDAEYGHIDAMNLLFAPYCPDRDDLCDFAKLLLPLPLNIYYADCV